MNNAAQSGPEEGRWLDVVVSRKALIAEGVMQFELQRADGEPLPAFTAGAHIDVILPNGLVRQYSLCNDPAEPGHYEIGVLLEPHGRGGSISAHAEVHEGMPLTISVPRNLFGLVTASHSVLVAGGIGVTPILAMAAQLHQAGVSFEMHYCARSKARMAYQDRLASAPYWDQVSLHWDDGPASQRFDAASHLPPPREGTHLYVCGPQGFMDHVIQTLSSRGWPPGNIHFEYFAGAPVDHTADGSFEIQLGRQGPVVTVPADLSAAQALAKAGVQVPLSCEQGFCGTCALRVLEGTPDHRDVFFSDAEKAANDRFTPCCSRAKTPRLVVALGS